MHFLFLQFEWCVPVKGYRVERTVNNMTTKGGQDQLSLEKMSSFTMVASSMLFCRSQKRFEFYGNKKIGSTSTVIN